MVFLRSIFGLVSLAVLSGCQMGSPRTPASNDLSGMLAELNHQSDSDGLGSTGAVRPSSRPRQPWANYACSTFATTDGPWSTQNLHSNASAKRIPGADALYRCRAQL